MTDSDLTNTIDSIQRKREREREKGNKQGEIATHREREREKGNIERKKRSTEARRMSNGLAPVGTSYHNGG